MDKQLLDNKLIRLIVTDKTSKLYNILLKIMIAFGIMLDIFIIGLTFRIKKDIMFEPTKLLCILVVSTIITVVIVAVIGLISILIITACEQTDIVIKNFLKGINDLNLTMPVIKVYLDSVASFHAFDEDKLASYLIDKEKLLEEQKCNIIYNKELCNKIYRDLLGYLDTISKITKRDLKNVEEIFNNLSKIHDQFSTLNVYVVYDSLYDKNKYGKKLEIQDLKLLELSINKKTIQQNRAKKTDAKLQDALTLYMLKMPFTLEDLKSKRHMLLKAFHPDETDEAARNNYTTETIRINDAFDTLKKYAQ